jgi:hypothetical protein
MPGVHPVDHVPNKHHSVEVTYDFRPGANGRRVGKDVVDRPEAEAPSPEEPVDGVAAPVPEDGEKARGVIRLLEAGHFRGVADVRLRINFFEELSARASTAAGEVAVENSGELAQSVNSAVAQLLENLNVSEADAEAVDGLLSEFDSAVQAAVEEFNSADAVGTQGLSGSLQAAFESFVQALRPLVEPPAPEPKPATDPAATKDPQLGDVGMPTSGAGVTTADDGTVAPDEPVGVTEQAWTELVQAFDAALAAFLAPIGTAAQLPDPSPPHGNGVAYDKFLAIYNALRGSPPSDVDDVG